MSEHEDLRWYVCNLCDLHVEEGKLVTHMVAEHLLALWNATEKRFYERVRVVYADYPQITTIE